MFHVIKQKVSNVGKWSEISFCVKVGLILSTLTSVKLAAIPDCHSGFDSISTGLMLATGVLTEMASICDHLQLHNFNIYFIENGYL